MKDQLYVYLAFATLLVALLYLLAGWIRAGRRDRHDKEVLATELAHSTALMERGTIAVARAADEREALLARVEAAETKASMASAKAVDYEARFWSLHELVSEVMAQREEWIGRYRVEVAEHLEGQSILEQRIMAERQIASRAIATLNRIRLEADATAKPLPVKDLDPVDLGQVKRYFESQRRLLKRAPQIFDATIRQKRLAADMEATGSAKPKTVPRSQLRAAAAEAEALKTVDALVQQAGAGG